MSTRYNDWPVALPPSPTQSVDFPPGEAPVELPNLDARTHALRVLARWFSALQYRRTMAPGQPAQPFAIEPERVFIEQPDNIEGLQFPAIGIIPGRGQYLVRGLGGADPDESTFGIAGPNTALLVPYDYQELLTVEGWGSKISERRSIIAAIEVAIGSYQGTTDLRLLLPDYYGFCATFSLIERENVDDLEVPRGRRRVHLFLQMTVPVAVIGRFSKIVGPYANVTVNGSLGLGVGAGGVTGQAAVRAKLEASARAGGAAGLAVFGLTVPQAQTVARAVLGVTQAQAAAMTDEYLLALVQSVAAHQASLETWRGRPPYSPGSVEALDRLRALQRPGAS